MAELKIAAAVGASPAPNNPADVKTVQGLLATLKRPLRTTVTVNGISDANLIKAIREFQSRFFARPDGRVDPGQRTLFHLNNHAAPTYKGCNAYRRKAIDKDLMLAQTWLDVVNRGLAAHTSARTRRLVDNIFHVDLTKLNNATQFLRYEGIKLRFRQLRISMDQPFPIQCDKGRSISQAYVDLNDPTGTMFFPPGHFTAAEQERIGTIIHERAHTIFQISHAGMRGGGEMDFGTQPDDKNKFTWYQAYSNAYCYGWLAMAMQPTYTRNEVGVIRAR